MGHSYLVRLYLSILARSVLRVIPSNSDAREILFPVSVNAAEIVSFSASSRLRTTAVDAGSPDIDELARFEEIDLEYKEAYINYEEAANLNPNITLYLVDAGMMANKLAKHIEAISYLELALENSQKIHGKEDLATAGLYNNFGIVYDSLKQHGKALTYYKLALKITTETYGENHLFIASVRNNIGTIYSVLGDYENALESFRFAFQSILQTYGENHPLVSGAYSNIGGVYGQLGKFTKAIEHFQLSKKIYLLSYSHKHPEVARQNCNIGSCKRRCKTSPLRR